MEQGMGEYSEEQASMLRLNMAIVEERTCQWSLFQVTFETAFHTSQCHLTLPFDKKMLRMWKYRNLETAFPSLLVLLPLQRGLRDLEDAVRDDNNVTEFNTIIETHKISRDYIEKYQKVTGIDDRENFCARLRYVQVAYISMFFPFAVYLPFQILPERHSKGLRCEGCVNYWRE